MTELYSEEARDHAPMTRGKYGPDKGNPRTVEWVAKNDPAYLAWAYEEWSFKPCSAALYADCKKDLEEAAQQRRVSKDQDRSID